MAASRMAVAAALIAAVSAAAGPSEAGDGRGVNGERAAPGPSIAWDLVVVAWDYLPTARGEFPGCDDAERNMPLSVGRNALAADRILREADRASLRGFSSDLFILQASSASAKRDGPPGALYACLRRGERYGGRFAAPLEEIAAIYRALRAGRAPAIPAEAPQGASERSGAP